eukprot:TRINITY_DN62191_c0_g3_i1.p1 TRINITY_DN62191_c0_g3~~TRINITY_DN62191_c0_g3_i1.p1  ORF type:complete len:484 (-),score=73.49 TRINITY_DN62191_c0_g3_i1:1491-2942(-)
MSASGSGSGSGFDLEEIRRRREATKKRLAESTAKTEALRSRRQQGGITGLDFSSLANLADSDSEDSVTGTGNKLLAVDTPSTVASPVTETPKVALQPATVAKPATLVATGSSSALTSTTKKTPTSKPDKFTMNMFLDDDSNASSPAPSPKTGSQPTDEIPFQTTTGAALDPATVTTAAVPVPVPATVTPAPTTTTTTPLPVGQPQVTPQAPQPPAGVTTIPLAKPKGRREDDVLSTDSFMYEIVCVDRATQTISEVETQTDPIAALPPLQQSYKTDPKSTADPYVPQPATTAQPEAQTEDQASQSSAGPAGNSGGQQQDAMVELLQLMGSKLDNIAQLLQQGQGGTNNNVATGNNPASALASSALPYVRSLLQEKRTAIANRISNSVASAAVSPQTFANVQPPGPTLTASPPVSEHSCTPPHQPATPTTVQFPHPQAYSTLGCYPVPTTMFGYPPQYPPQFSQPQYAPPAYWPTANQPTQNQQ